MISTVTTDNTEYIEGAQGVDSVLSQDIPLQWVPPSYDLSKSPSLLYTQTISPSDASPSNFARWAKWCPDGSTAIAQCEDASLRYLDFCHEVLSPAPDVTAIAKRSMIFRQAAPVLDFTWYPRATCTDPASFCFVVSVRESPVKLLDGADGRLRASYKIVDHRERQIAPYSLAFNPTSTKLYCGFDEAIEVFDVDRPGEGTRLHTTPSKKNRDGLKGIISSLAFSPDLSSGVYAAGSFSHAAPTSSNIALFTEASGEVPVMYLGNENSGRGYGIRSSVSQLMFNPMRPYLLYASFRRDDTIYCWDIRGHVGSPVETFNYAAPAANESREQSHSSAEPLGKSQSPATNQRLRFDIDISGNCLAVGDHGGDVALFDLQATHENNAGSEAFSDAPTQATGRNPTLKFKAHEDAVGSAAFHPLCPLLLSVSGSRHYDVESLTDDEEESGSSDSDDDAQETRGPRGRVSSLIKRPMKPPVPVPRDTTVKLWNFAHAS